MKNFVKKSRKLSWTEGTGLKSRQKLPKVKGGLPSEETGKQKKGKREKRDGFARKGGGQLKRENQSTVANFFPRSVDQRKGGRGEVLGEKSGGEGK